MLGFVLPPFFQAVTNSILSGRLRFGGLILEPVYLSIVDHELTVGTLHGGRLYRQRVLFLGHFGGADGTFHCVDLLIFGRLLNAVMCLPSYYIIALFDTKVKLLCVVH